MPPDERGAAPKIRRAPAALCILAVAAASLCAATTAWTQEHEKTADAARTRSKADSKTGLRFVRIPGGRFHFGCEPADAHCFADEKPGRDVSVRAFWLAQTDVTVAMWSRCVAAGVCAPPNTGGSCNWQVAGRDRHPVNCITWQQARTFCEWIGARLPTEQEWEFAAKGGEHRVYPWGDEPVSGTRANYCDAKCHDAHPDWTWTDRSQDDGWASTSPVGSFPAGASRQGLLDLVGNAAQWTSTDGAEGTKQAKGGGWDLYPRYLRNSGHVRLNPARWFDNVTVRCAQ